jgi:hypothetical protein
MSLREMSKFCAAILLVGVAGCGHPAATDPPPPQPRVTLTASPSQVPYKGTVQWVASANYAGTLVWSSSDQAVATVDANGMVTGQKPGSSEVCVKLSGTDAKDCRVASVLPPEFVTVKFEFRPSPPDNGIALLAPIEGMNADGSYFVRHPDGKASIPNQYDGTYFTVEWEVRPGSNLTLRVGVFRATGKFERWLGPNEMVLNGTRLQRASPVMPAPSCAASAECKEGAGAYFDLAYDGVVTP